MPFDEFRGGGTTWDDWDPSQLFQGKSFAFVLLYFRDSFYIDSNKAIPLDSDQIFVFFVGNTLSLPNLQSFHCPHDDCLHHLNTVFVEAAVGKLA